VFVISRSGFGGRNAFGRKPGGDIFGALDFVRMPMFIDLFLGSTAHDFGAGLGGLAVRSLLLAVSQPAGRAETHSAPATPGKISVTHNSICLSIDINVLEEAYGD
jgi:hypothetical protein